MLSRRTDLPLGRDTTSRVVPWIIALMAYLAALALAGTLLLNAFAARWDAGRTSKSSSGTSPANPRVVMRTSSRSCQPLSPAAGRSASTYA